MTTAPDPPQPDRAEPDHTQPDVRGRGDAAGHTSRRGLLIGAAGLIVGAGATQAGNSLTATKAATELHVASPGEELMIEHGVLKRVLLAYRAAASRLASGELPPAGAITDAAQIISDYVESFHEGLEEAYVFPRVQQTNTALVRTLLIQHDRGRHLTAAILTTASADLASPATRTALQTYLNQFVRMYEPHEAWEDTVIYPALRAATPQRTLDQLAERFADLENTHSRDHALTQILDRVAGVEQQLAIADLATFTPPDPPA
jgi:hemerythrin-like domain-containing protein